jgi:hypothetical protein
MGKAMSILIVARAGSEHESECKTDQSRHHQVMHFEQRPVAHLAG